jgi:hypothetical protein
MTPVVVGLDGGYVRSRHRQEERHFEVIAGKVIDVDGIQHRFAFARNGHALEQDDSAVLPRRPYRRAERQPGGRLSPSLSRIPTHQL